MSKTGQEMALLHDVWQPQWLLAGGENERDRNGRAGLHERSLIRAVGHPFNPDTRHHPSS